MSIIEISFHLIKCLPPTNYSNYLYTIYSNQTNFNETITYNAHNTVTDVIDYKTDLQYYLKVYNSADLVGVTNFTIQSKSFYKKHKKQLIELQLTLSEKAKRQLKDEGLVPEMSVKLLLTFNYIEKKIGYRKRRSVEKALGKSEMVKDLHVSPIIHKTSQRKLFEDLSSSFKKPFDMIRKASRKVINKSSSVTSCHDSIDKLGRVSEEKLKEEMTKEKEADLSVDNSVIDSIVGVDDADYSSSDNEEKKTAIQEIKKLKKQLSFDATSTNKKPLSASEMKDKTIQLSTEFIIAHKALSLRLGKALEEKEKLKSCLNKYNEKYRNIIKKEHKLIQRKDIYAMKHQLTTSTTRKLNEIREEAMNAKRIEYELGYELLKDLGVRRREEDIHEPEKTEKEFFIEIFKILIDLKANIADTISPIKRDNLIYLCEKYDIPLKETECISGDIKEEDEDECDNKDKAKADV